MTRKSSANARMMAGRWHGSAPRNAITKPIKRLRGTTAMAMINVTGSMLERTPTGTPFSLVRLKERAPSKLKPSISNRTGT